MTGVVGSAAGWACLIPGLASGSFPNTASSSGSYRPEGTIASRRRSWSFRFVSDAGRGAAAAGPGSTCTWAEENGGQTD